MNQSESTSLCFPSFCIPFSFSFPSVRQRLGFYTRSNEKVRLSRSHTMKPLRSLLSISRGITLAIVIVIIIAVVVRSTIFLKKREGKATTTTTTSPTSIDTESTMAGMSFSLFVLCLRVVKEESLHYCVLLSTSILDLTSIRTTVSTTLLTTRTTTTTATTEERPFFGESDDCQRIFPWGR